MTTFTPIASLIGGGLIGLAAVLLMAFNGRIAGMTGVPAPWLVIGGLVVGVGVYFGSGCTSGHGVCGIARLSPRSIVATLTFMVSTAATVFVVRHVLGGF